jgi:dipeptidyl-peptidase-4
VLPRAGNVRPHSFLLVHGTGDDNVQFMNSAVLVESLVRAGVPFEAMYYPDRNHGIRGQNTRPHLYALLLSFLQRALALPGGAAT